MRTNPEIASGSQCRRTKANAFAAPPLVKTLLHLPRRSSYLLHPQWAPTELVDCYSWFLPSACLALGWHCDDSACRAKKTAKASRDVSGALIRGADFAPWHQSGIGLLARVRLRLWWLRLCHYRPVYPWPTARPMPMPVAVGVASAGGSGEQAVTATSGWQTRWRRPC